MVKNIFNSGKHKDGVGMKIPSWMIMDEMNLTDHYQMYVVVFRVDVPMTQSQPIEYTQGTHRTLSAPSTRLEARSDKESLKVEIAAKVQLVNINEEAKSQVPDVPIYDSKSDKDSWGDIDEKDDDRDEFEDDADINDDDSDDNDESEKMDEEEDDEVTKELYKDVNVNLGNKDAKMTDADQSGADQQNAS
nr:hypothetical protein [Tanacetum cinerariifolium]